MTWRAAVLLALATALAGCASPGGTRQSVAAEAPLRQELEAALAAGTIPGARVIVARQGRVAADVTVGHADLAARTPIDEDTLFRLYSMSKPITSVAIMMLAEQGRLRLDDPAARYLPEWRDMRVYASGGLDAMVTVPVSRPVTIADLLTHTAGITYHFAGTTPVHQYYRKHGVMRDTPVGRQPGDGAPARTLDELVARLGRAPMLQQPGTGFAYSYSTTVLGAIVERVGGQRLDRFLAERLFTPLGMTRTGFFVSDADLPHFATLYAATPDGLTVVEQPETSDYRDSGRLLDGGGAIVGTAGDYLRFAQMLANGGTLDGRRILSEASIDTLFTPRVEIAEPGQPPVPFGYGFALGTAATQAAGGLPAGVVSWSGSGNTYFFVDQQARGVALAMAQFLGTGAPQDAVRGATNRAYARAAGN
jgi:CubicO group peptidase (beta-lactamase class C family)